MPPAVAHLLLSLMPVSCLDCAMHPPCLLPSFYQSRPGTCQWHWGVGWDHVVSTDLAHWTRLPPAIFPSSGRGGADADGCFSGSILVSGLRATTTDVVSVSGLRCALVVQRNRRAGVRMRTHDWVCL